MCYFKCLNYNKSEMRYIIHYFLHFLFPGVIAKFYRPDDWKKAWLILVSTNLIDLDHLLADPIYDPNRMSIGFHLLHSYYAIVVYFLFLLHPKTRLIGIGLLLHIATDILDFFLI